MDFETTGQDPHFAQPTQLASVMIDARKLTICDNGIFNSYCNIVPDDKVDAHNLRPVQPEALIKSNITLEQIQSSPPLKTVWKNYINWMKFHNPSNDKWNAPIFCGQNIEYDQIIMGRIQNGHLGGLYALTEKPPSKKNMGPDYKPALFKEPWKFGGHNIFHPVYKVDLLQLSLLWWESNKNPSKLNQDAIKEFLGLPKDGAHNALADCLYTAEILVRFIKLTRQVSEETEFEGTCNSTVLPIESILENAK